MTLDELMKRIRLMERAYARTLAKFDGSWKWQTQMLNIQRELGSLRIASWAYLSK